MSEYEKRKVAQSKVDLAKKALTDNPLITAVQFGKDYKISKDTAGIAIKRARQELRDKEDEVRQKGNKLRERQQTKALQVLNNQLSRLESLPEILVALRSEVFITNDLGTVTGLRESIKGYNKQGDPIYNTPASIVNEYLEAEKRIIEQERLVTGIAAAEKQQAATAGKTEINLQLPASPELLKSCKPIDS